MGFHFPQQLWKALRSWWRTHASQIGSAGAAFLLFRTFLEFLFESTPSRRRQRFGDMEYDWEKRVDTTSGTVSWRARLLGLFHSPYQPTDPALFHEMMASLPVAFDAFTFIDIGSGKGRTLLLASEYPFRKIVGVEILPELHEIAQENLSRYQSESQKCFALESICGDGSDFPFPADPLLIYLFNPLPESGLKQMTTGVKKSLRAHPRAVYLLYHNPLLEGVLAESPGLTKIAGTSQYSLYAFAGQD